VHTHGIPQTKKEPKRL